VTIVPSDEALAAYLTVVVTTGVEVAEQAFPELTIHVAACPLCQVEVESILGALGEGEHTAADAQVSLAAPRAAEWERLHAGALRLRSPYEIWVQRSSLHITSALVDPQIESEPEPGEEPSLSEQSFSVSLCEDLTTAQDGWVRV